MAKPKLTFINSALVYTAGTVFSQGAVFLTLLVLARLMPVTDYALISLYALWVNIFASVIGAQSFFSFNNARLDYGDAALARYVSATFGMGVVSYAALMLLAAVFRRAFEAFLGFPIGIVLLCVTQSFFAYAVLQLAARYRAVSRPLPFVAWSCAPALLRLGLSIALVLAMTQNKYLGDIYGSSIAYALIGTAACAVIFARGRRFYDAAMWKYCLKLSVPFVFMALSSLVLGQASRYMLERLANLYESGVYSYAFTISLIVSAVWAGCDNVWIVWYFGKAAAGKSAEIVALYNKYAWFVTLFSGCIVLLSPDIARLLGGDRYAGSGALLPMLTGACFCTFMCAFATAYETFKKRTHYIAAGALIAALLSVALNWALIPRMGAKGAALATAGGYATLLLFHCAILKTAVKGFEIPVSKLLLPVGFVALTVAAAYLLSGNLAPRIGASAVLAVGCAVLFRRAKNVLAE